MEPSVAAELGATWPARGGAGGGAPDPFLSARSANPRASRWSDAPPGQVPLADGKDRRPSPSGLDPPVKRFRPNDVTSANANPVPPVAGSDSYGSGLISAYGVDSGYPDGPPGLLYGQSAPSATAGGGVGGAVQSYGTPGASIYGSSAPYGAGQSSGFAPGSAKGTGALFYKTKLCTKFKLGGCTFNERCHFAHGMEDLRKPPPGWESMVASGNVPTGGGMAGNNADRQQPRKTNKPCRYFVSGSCPYGDRCTFLHGDEEPQVTPGVDSASGGAGARGPNVSRAGYKTRMCARWERGEPCNFGEKCHFAHGPAELQGYGGGSTYSTAPEASTYNTGAELPYPNAKPEISQSYPSAKPEYAPTYSDPSMANPPAAAAPYGQAPMNNAWSGPSPVAAGFNPYQPVAGSDMKPYGSGQDGTNGPTASFNYLGMDKQQQPANPTSSQSHLPVQGYMQPNQGAPWVASYPVEGAYSATYQYTQEQGQQQQPQSAAFYGGGNDQKQSYGTSYVQGNFQNEVTNGSSGYYHGAYNGANYPIQ